MTFDEAFAELASIIDADRDPQVETIELERLLANARRSDLAGNPPSNIGTVEAWEPSTVYAVGDVITADPSVGRFWMCVVPGTSDTTQPDWPDQSGEPAHLVRVSDGTAVEWLDVGTTWNPTYDLNAAAVAGCLLKASKAASRFDFTTDGQTFQRSQIVAHWRQMAGEYRRKGARAVAVI